MFLLQLLGVAGQVRPQKVQVLLGAEHMRFVFVPVFDSIFMNFRCQR